MGTARSFFSLRPRTAETRRRNPPEPLHGCCRYLAGRAGQLADDDPLKAELAAVVVEYDRACADPAVAGALSAGERPWPEVAGRLLEAMLSAAEVALVSDPSLTALIADTVLRARQGSRAAWRLLGQAHEQWGDLGAAIRAHEEYLARTEDDRLRVAELVTSLRRVHDARTALTAALDAARTAGGGPLTSTTAAATATRVRELLARPVRQEVLDPALEDLLDQLSRLATTDLAGPGGTAGPDQQAQNAPADGAVDVLHAALTCLRATSLEPPPLPEEAVEPLAVVRLGDLRSHLAGRRVCIVAPRLASEGLAAGVRPDIGTRIDEYDVVARVCPSTLEPVVTGARTDLMVLRHDQRRGWDRPTDLRMVLAEDPRDWELAVRRNLVPGAQRALVEKALRRPAHQSSLVGADRSPRRVTNAFQLIRLLHHLDVTPVIDLVGFAAPRALTAAEREWVDRHTQDRDDDRIALR